MGSLNLICEMLKNGVTNLVFLLRPLFLAILLLQNFRRPSQKLINPYGRTKLTVENMLKDICSAYSFNATCFRYFNAAGACATGTIGEAHEQKPI